MLVLILEMDASAVCIWLDVKKIEAVHRTQKIGIIHKSGVYSVISAYTISLKVNKLCTRVSTM